MRILSLQTRSFILEAAYEVFNEALDSAGKAKLPVIIC